MPKLAIIKTQPSSSSVAAFIDSIADEQKRKDSLRRCWCFSPTTELQVSPGGERKPQLSIPVTPLLVFLTNNRTAGQFRWREKPPIINTSFIKGNENCLL